MSTWFPTCSCSSTSTSTLTCFWTWRWRSALLSTSSTSWGTSSGKSANFRWNIEPKYIMVCKKLTTWISRWRLACLSASRRNWGSLSEEQLGSLLRPLKWLCDLEHLFQEMMWTQISAGLANYRSHLRVLFLVCVVQIVLEGSIANKCYWMIIFVVLTNKPVKGSGIGMDLRSQNSDYKKITTFFR